jgi:hypothetical protein
MLHKWLPALAVLAISASGVGADEIEIQAAREQKIKATEIRLMADGSYQIQGPIHAVDAEKGTLKLKTPGVVEVGPGTIQFELGGSAEKEFTLAKDVKIIGADGKEIVEGVKARFFEKPGGMVTIAFVKKDGKAVVTQLKLDQAAQPLLRWVVPQKGGPVVPMIERKLMLLDSAPGAGVRTLVPAESDRERRLKAIEEHLQKLLKEVQELRGGGVGAAQETARAQAVARLRSLRGQLENQLEIQRKKAVEGAPQPRTIALSRATYPIPKARAEQLSALLKEVKAEVLEVKIDGDALVVTTTPEAQKTIGEFVSFLVGQTKGAQGPATPTRP